MRLASIFLAVMACAQVSAAENTVVADDIRAGRTDAVRAYFEAHKADIDAQLLNGMPAVTVAIGAGKPDILRLLLDRGADPNALNSTRDFTPLHAAVSVDSPAMIDLLVAHQANLELQNRSGIAPLGEALIHGRTASIGRLLERGARCDAASANGMSTLFMANFLPWPDEDMQVDVVARLLACGANLQAKTDSGETALWPALRGKRDKMAKFLISKGISVTDRVRGRTPLHMAAQYEMGADVMEAMIAKGADASVRDADGITPFLAAVISGNRAGAEFLLSRGASVGQTDAVGRTALHFAADGSRPGRGAIAELLIARGASVDAKTPDAGLMFRETGNTTPLHKAAVSGNLEVARVLLDHGAQADAMNAADETPLSLALDRERFDLARELVRRGANIDLQSRRHPAALLKAVQSNKLETVRFLLANRANPNLRAVDDGRTALHEAARAGKAELVKELLAQGADAGAKDEGGFTPWNVATGDDVRALLGPTPSVSAAVDAGDAAKKACNLVLEKANAGALSDLNGEPVKTGEFRQSPRNDWESDNLRWADTELVFSADGRKYVLGMQDGAINYVAQVSSDNIEEVACEFEEADSVQRIVSETNAEVCSAAMIGGLEYVTYDHLHALTYESLQAGGHDRTHPGEKAARVDLDNDGREDYVVTLEIANGRCDAQFLGILNAPRTRLDEPRSKVVGGLDAACGTTARPFVLQNVTYIDIDAPASGADRHHLVWKVARNEAKKVCDIAVRSTYRLLEATEPAP